MTDTAAASPRRRSWGRIVGLVLGILLLLLVLLYFICTSSGFIRGVILPKVSKSIGVEVTASEVSLSPFKHLVLKDLKVQAPGRALLFTSPEIQVRYSLTDIIRGNYNIQLISVASPVISIVQGPGQTSNLGPMEAAGGGEEKPKQKGESQQINLHLAKLVVTDGTIRYQKDLSDKGGYSSEITKLNFSITNLKTGGTGKLNVDAFLSMQSTSPAAETNGSMSGSIKGDMDIGLTPMLMPSLLKGDIRAQISDARGAYAMASGVALVFAADVTPSEVKEIALRLLQHDKTLSEIVASGPFSAEKKEGKLTVRLSNVDRQTLNLFTAGTGMDFNKTSISSTNTVNISKGGNMIAASGDILVSDFQVTLTNQATPVLNLRASYDATVDQAGSKAVMQTLTLSGTQSGKQFLKGGLSAPMLVSWGGGAETVGDSEFVLTVSGFNLSDWKAFMGDAIESGVVNSEVRVLSKSSGKRITVTHKTELANLGMKVGSNRVSGVSIALSGDAEAQEMQQYQTKFDLQMTQDRKAPAVQVVGSGAFNAPTREARGQMTGMVAIPELVQMVPNDSTAFSSGSVKFSADFQQKGNSQEIKGDLSLTNLTGRIGSNTLANFAGSGHIDVARNGEKAAIRTGSLRLSQAGKPGGEADILGEYWLSSNVTEVKVGLKDLNQNALAPFLQPILGDKKLASISLNGDASVNYDPARPSSVHASFKMTDLVVKDPAGTVPEKPLAAGISFDSSIKDHTIEIQKATLVLTPTERAKNNQAQLAGQLDTSGPNGTSGHLSLTADSMDFTTYYALFQGQESQAVGSAKPAEGTPAPARNPKAAPAGPERPAEPIVLPLTNFVVDAKVGQLYLSELEITKLLAKVTINGGEIQVMPFAMMINGAPLDSTVDLDLGVPGYRYNVAFGMTNVPFAPLVNTFVPERKGQVGGTVTASAQLKGAGTTGEALQKHLNGAFLLTTTNLDLAVSELRSPLLKSVVNVIAVVPSILKNPGGGWSAFAGALLSGRSTPSSEPSDGGSGDEIRKSPINVIEANGEIGSGVVKLDQALIQSANFQASARGTIQLAKVLSNSVVNIPLGVSLARPLAEKIHLAPAGTPTNVAYVKLPDYVVIKGTIGEPKRDIDEKALLATALQVGGSSPGVDKETGSLLQGIGGLLGGKSAQTDSTNTASTNSPSTNNSVGNLIRGIFAPRKK